VLLVHRGDRLGGGLADDVPAGPTIAGDLAERAAREARLEIVTGADAFAWYEEGTVAVDRRPDLLLVDPAAVVLATGAYDTALPFPDWDLPGVMTATAARRLMSRSGVLPGSRAVILTCDEHAYRLAVQFVAGGGELACVADFREAEDREADDREAGSAGSTGSAGTAGTAGSAGGHPLADRDLLDELAARGVDLLTGLGGVTARGFSRVRSVTLHPLDRPGRVPRRARTYACDTVCYSAGVRPADDLAYQALCRGSVVLSDRGTAASGGGPLLAGLVAGVATASEAMAQGEAAGKAAAERARLG
jgi:hypothetical protein